MSKMQHPYQCLAAIKPTNGDSQHILTACGSKLLRVDVTRGTIASEWSSDVTAPNAANDEENNGDLEHPKKKQKTVPTSQSPPNVIKLAVSPDQQHAIAVTDDKSLHVFSLDDGKLAELSQRAMPKRLCAIDVLPDNATILCADKFGDVYSLPLLPASVEAQDAMSGAVEASPAPEKPAFKPSATTLTVHSQRNRKALEAQMAQKNFSAKKEPLKFEHKLLLGHVSMLTDMKFATQTVDEKQRSYIITADRDEHIRISRGPPQSHIIEGYCLGHQEYVSKICLISGTDLMVSGGGDTWLCVWELPSFKLRRKIEIYDYVLEVRASKIAPRIDVEYQRGGETSIDVPSDTADVAKVDKSVNISGMWCMPYQSAKGKRESALVVACERLPALFIINKSRLQLKTDKEFGVTILRLDQAPLDVTSVGDSMIVSLDAREEGQHRLQAYKLVQKEGEKDPWRVNVLSDGSLAEKLACLSKHSSGEETPPDAKALDELLYGVANLRKRRGWDTAEGAEEDISAVVPGEDAVVSDQVPEG